MKFDEMLEDLGEVRAELDSLSYATRSFRKSFDAVDAALTRVIDQLEGPGETSPDLVLDVPGDLGDHVDLARQVVVELGLEGSDLGSKLFELLKDLLFGVGVHNNTSLQSGDEVAPSSSAATLGTPSDSAGAVSFPALALSDQGQSGNESLAASESVDAAGDGGQFEQSLDGVGVVGCDGSTVLDGQEPQLDLDQLRTQLEILDARLVGPFRKHFDPAAVRDQSVEESIETASDQLAYSTVVSLGRSVEDRRGKLGARLLELLDAGDPVESDFSLELGDQSVDALRGIVRMMLAILGHDKTPLRCGDEAGPSSLVGTVDGPVDSAGSETTPPDSALSTHGPADGQSPGRGSR